MLLLAVIGPTAGRWYIDVSSRVAPKQFIRGEWFVVIAAFTGAIWLVCFAAGLNTWWCALFALVVGYTARVIALYRAWEEPLAKEPAGVYLHSDGRPMLGRKLTGKSQRELHDLGLAWSRHRQARNPRKEEPWLLRRPTSSSPSTRTSTSRPAISTPSWAR